VLSILFVFIKLYFCLLLICIINENAFLLFLIKLYFF